MGDSVQNVNQVVSTVLEQSFIYDAFGNRIGGDDPDTDYLYTGEQYDANVGFYYLRARYYNPDIGRFFTRDTYSGSNQDPMSLHKYLYCHANPVNNWDPTGRFSICEIAINMAIRSTVLAIMSPFIKPVEKIFAEGLIKGLLPSNLIDQIANYYPSALMFGGSSTGVVAKGVSVGFGGGIEVLFSPFTYAVGVYGYSEFVVGMSRAKTGLAFSAKAGFVFNAFQLQDYEKDFRCVTLPYKCLPKRTRNAIIEKAKLLPYEIMKLPPRCPFQEKLHVLLSKAKLLPDSIDPTFQVTFF